MTTLKPATAKKEVLKMGKLSDKYTLEEWAVLAVVTTGNYLDVNSFKSLNLLESKEAAEKFQSIYLCDFCKVITEMAAIYYEPFKTSYAKIERVLNELFGNDIFSNNWFKINGCNFDTVTDDSLSFDFSITYKSKTYRVTSKTVLIERLHELVQDDIFYLDDDLLCRYIKSTNAKELFKILKDDNRGDVLRELLTTNTRYIATMFFKENPVYWFVVPKTMATITELHNGTYYYISA